MNNNICISIANYEIHLIRSALSGHKLWTMIDCGYVSDPKGKRNGNMLSLIIVKYEQEISINKNEHMCMCMYNVHAHT